MQVFEYYPNLLGDLVLPLVGFLVVVALYLYFRPLPSEPVQPFRPASLPLHELALVLSLISLPLAAQVLAQYVTHGYHHRYVLPPVLGISFLIAWTCHRMFRGQQLAAVVLTVLLMGSFLFGARRDLGRLRSVNAEYIQMVAFVESNLTGDLPMAVTEVTRLHRMTFYAPPRLVRRIAYVSNPAASIHYLGHDTIDRGLLDLRPWFPLNTIEYKRFIAEHDQFLAFGYVGPWSWMAAKLVEDHLHSELVGLQADRLLLRVSPRGIPAGGESVQQKAALPAEVAPLPAPVTQTGKPSDPEASLCQQWMHDRLCRTLR